MSIMGSFIQPVMVGLIANLRYLHPMLQLNNPEMILFLKPMSPESEFQFMMIEEKASQDSPLHVMVMTE